METKKSFMKTKEQKREYGKICYRKFSGEEKEKKKECERNCYRNLYNGKKSKTKRIC